MRRWHLYYNATQNINMKKLAIVVLLIAAVAGGGLALGLFPNEVEYKSQNEVPAEPEVEIQRVNELNERIEAAQAEARGGIEAEAQAAYEQTMKEAEVARDKFIDDGLTAVSDKVKEDYIAEIEATIKSPSY